MSLIIGAPAPDFELPDQHGQTVRLSALRGQKAALLVFYPWAFSRVCGTELDALQDRLDEVVSEDVELLTISCDPTFSLRAYADQKGFTFPLLSDFWPHGAVASAYDVLDQATGIALRGSFLVDKDGVLRWSVLNGIPDARDIDDYKKAIADL